MNRAEELIADLEAEIVKRDARIAELEAESQRLHADYSEACAEACADAMCVARDLSTLKEKQRGGVMLPDPFGWVGGGLFFYDRDKAIEAAAKSPCVEVYSRPQILAVINPTGAYVAAIDWPDAPITVESGFIVVDGKHLPTITLTMPAVLPSDMPAWDKRDNLTASIRTILAQQGKAVES